MTDRFWTIAVSAGAGIVATAAGIFVASRFRNLLKRKPKMKLFNNHLLLSTRCSWMIKELGVESDLELFDEDLPSKFSKSGFKVETTATLLGHKEPSLACFANPKDCKLVLSGSRPVPEGDDVTDYDLEQYAAAPALVVNDEFTMIEGAAICMYLADMYGDLLPEAQHKAEYYRWIVYTASTFDNIVKTLHHQLINTPLIDQDQDVLRMGYRSFHSFMRALEDTLGDSEYICGNKFTAADCVVGFTLWWAYTIQDGSLMTAYPTILAYLDRIRARPAFSSTFGDDESWDWNQLVPSYLQAVPLTR